MACPSFSFVPCWFFEVQEPEQDDGSTWEQQANDVWGGGKRMGRVHTKRVGTNLNDCEHGKARSVCMQGCGGGSICEHGKARSVCTQGCGGGSICEHGATHSLCTQGCGGGSICEHGKARSVCTQGCGGGGICEHGKARSV